MQKKIIQIGRNSYQLIFDDFDEEIDIDSILKIDYSNLIGELITFPVIVNRFGNLLADAESKVSEEKLNLDVFEAKIKEKAKEDAIKNKEKIPTLDSLNNVLLLNKTDQMLKKHFIKTQKMRDYINSIFWSIKDKSTKLDKLSLTIQNQDIPDSVIEGRINNVLIKKTKKLID